MVVLALTVVTFGGTIADVLKNKYMGLNTPINIILKLGWLWQFLILFGFFLLMYKFVPKHKVKFRTQIPGALFSALGWYVLSWAFSVYLDVFKNFSIIYGSLTSIMLLMIWVYWCMNIILIGAEINMLIKKKFRNKLHIFKED